MGILIAFNLGLIFLIAVILFLCKRFVKSDRSKNIVLIVASILTILCHYSSLLYHYCLDNSALTYLRQNPNLILPIYPCNVVMWSCLIFALCKNKQSRFAQFLADYIFWFGILSTLVGMFANVDFIRNPTLSDYDITKGIVAHATMLFNILLVPLFGHIKIQLGKNMLHILLSIILMYFIGLYCNLFFTVLVSNKTAYFVNSMFILHSPFDGVEFLTYPIIALISVVFYFLLFNVCELFAYKRGERWFNRFYEKFIQKNSVNIKNKE